MDKIIWQNLKSTDARKGPALVAIRRAAGVATNRVTVCKISKCGTLARGNVLFKVSEPQTVTVNLETGERVTS